MQINTDAMRINTDAMRINTVELELVNNESSYVVKGLRIGRHFTN